MTAFRFPWDDDPPRAPPRGEPLLPPPPKRRGRRPPPPAARTDWVQSHLLASGPAPEVARLVAAARGPGGVPWAVDGPAVEETVAAMALLDAPGERSLTAPEIRIMARLFRDKAEMRRLRLLDRGRAPGCPFDLNALLPVPHALLERGADHPETTRWLLANWGLRDAPRKVAAIDVPAARGRKAAGPATAGWYMVTGDGLRPDAAVARLAADYPALSLRLVAAAR